MRTRLGHPVSVDNRALVLSRQVVVPMPSLGVDGLTDGSEDSKGGEVMVLDVLVTHSSEKSNGGGGSVELGGLPLVDKVPVSSRGRVDRGGLEDGGRDTVEQRSVDDISVTGDPSDIGHASELVIGVDVKHVFDSQESSEEVSSCRVDDTLGLSCRSRSL